MASGVPKYDMETYPSNTESLAEQEQPQGREGLSLTTVAAKLEESRNDVLDLSLRNSLLNFRPSKRRGLQVADERSDQIFRILVGEERVMHFLPIPEELKPQTHLVPAGIPPAPNTDELTNPLDDISPELLALLSESETNSGETAKRHTDNKLQTALTQTNLNLRLRETFRQARLSIEEQGVNILYLSLGMLRWYESDDSENERCAPLVLIPVQLNRSDTRAKFKLSWTKDTIEANLSLEEKLRRDFHTHLPEISAEDELNINEYLKKIGQAVKKQQRWSVKHDEIHLNFFSFSKLLIYKDMDPDVWPEEKKPANHSIIQKLFGTQGFEEPVSKIEENTYIDYNKEVANLSQVMDSDSSQTLAVLDAINGCNLVIQGPPGTGKSQTITNLIGEALSRGKKVLFVAEKMAALEVVKRRLDTIHLGDACFELHSHKANKRAVLNELKRTWEIGCPKNDGRSVDTVLLNEKIKRLNDYSQTINTPVKQSNLTPHELIGRLMKFQMQGLNIDTPRLDIQDSLLWNVEDFTKRRTLVEEIQKQVETIGNPREHLWWPCGLCNFPPTDVPKIRERLQKVSVATNQLYKSSTTFSIALCKDNISKYPQRTEMEMGFRTTHKVLSAPKILSADHRNTNWTDNAERITIAAKNARRYADIRSQYNTILIHQAWNESVLTERQILQDYKSKWWRFLSKTFRNTQRKIKGLCRAMPPKLIQEQIDLLNAILESNYLRKTLEKEISLINELFPDLVFDDHGKIHYAFAEAAEWLVQIHSDKAKKIVGEYIHNLLDNISDDTKLKMASDDCQHDLKMFSKEIESFIDLMDFRHDRFESNELFGKKNFDEFYTWLCDAKDNIHGIFDIVLFNQLENKASEMGIAEVIEAAASRNDAGQQLTNIFEHSCYTTWLDLAFRERPALSQFNGVTHEEVINQFRELDMAQFQQNQILIAKKHWENLPNDIGGGNIGILRREFQKKRRHLPVRKLIEHAGRAIQAIKPVFMMSPLSIAKYIPPGSIEFDLVVFDEASQVRPVEALGAIIRGKQAVVVGDSKQLPPTSFFDHMADEEENEDNQTADLESILGMFCAQGAPERMLRWHYRSRHESLITVSNYEFYDNRLVVFPSPDVGKEDTGLVFRHNPNAQYQRRGINTDEAKIIAQAVMEHARKTPNITLGVAAFSNVQARRIEDEVDILRRQDTSCENFFVRHPDEPFFVKNLENIQGDERDVIMISIGYGKINGGRLPMNFGPLNKDGGERRLNVLITRARRRCVVHSNFVGSDLDLRRSQARGIKALKTFLEYAETGNIDTPEVSGRDPDSPFEEAVADSLRKCGYDISHQVGSAGFFIDLAISDPKRPGRYLLGIECDGASYHSAHSTRDRDRLRQQILEGLGWNIHRIWSTDWFRNPSHEIEKVKKALTSVQISPLPNYVNRRPKTTKPLERIMVPQPQITLPTTPYKIAQLDITLLWPLHGTPLDQLANWIGQVVSVESPVHLDEVIQRIRVAADLGRAGARIREQITCAAKWGENLQMYRVDEAGFLWHPGHTITKVRHRNESISASLRNPEMIAKEEISIALIYIVRTRYGIESDEAISETAYLFGYQKTSSRIKSHFQDVLDLLVAKGKLIREKSILQMPKKSH